MESLGAQATLQGYSDQPTSIVPKPFASGSQTFMPSSSGTHTFSEPLESYQISLPTKEQTYIKEIESLLEGTPDNEQIVELYKNISDYLLENDRCITSRDNERNTFKNIDIDHDLFMAVRKLLARYVEQRYQHFHDKVSKETSEEWFIQKEWQDWFKTVASEKDVNGLVDQKNPIKVKALRFMGLGLIDAWSSILREHICVDTAFPPKFRNAVKVDSNLHYFDLMPKNINDDSSFDYFPENSFDSHRLVPLHPQAEDPNYPKEIRDQVELFHLFTGTHRIMKTLETPDTKQISSESVCTSVADNHLLALTSAGNKKQKCNPRLLTAKNKVSPQFFNTNLSFPDLSNHNGILTVLQPKNGMLWFFSRNIDDISLSDMVRSQMGSLLGEASNIIYFSIAPFETELAELEEVADLFINLPQFDVFAPFRTMENYQELAPDNGQFTLQNFELIQNHLSKNSTNNLSMTFSSASQDFNFIIQNRRGVEKNQILSSPFQWKQSNEKQPAHNSLMKHALVFLLESYNEYQGAISHSRAEHLHDPVYDKNGYVFERQNIIKWLESNPTNPTNPITRQSMLYDRDIHSNPYMHQQWVRMRAISLKHDLSKVKIPHSSNMPSNSSAQPISDVASKVICDYQEKQRELNTQFEQQLKRSLGQQFKDYREQVESSEKKMAQDLIFYCEGSSEAEAEPKVQNKKRERLSSPSSFDDLETSHAKRPKNM